MTGLLGASQNKVFAINLVIAFLGMVGHGSSQ